VFVQDVYGAADPAHRLKVRVITEMAWHSLFARNMFLLPSKEELATFEPDFTIIHCPQWKSDPKIDGTRSEVCVIIHLARREILIGGSLYTGEIKKSVFTLLNWFLPAKGVLPMHASANIGPNGDVAIYFGLSGTGKTTLSSDSTRTLIGDDEHGWSDNGVFNFEGGCYAKTINLSQTAEPEIYAASRRWGTLLENVVLNPVTRLPDFDDGTLAENARSSYPMSYIPNASANGMGGLPKHVIMLTADAFGVLPPISRLSAEQAMYHFLSGYTAKVAGTEIGVTEPTATFSTCFGAAFMPRHPSVYGNLLKKRIAEGGAECWLVNTGWSGGKASDPGIKRMPIKATRALLNAALDGSLNDAEFRKDPNFGFEVPVAVPGVDSNLLDPRAAWSDKDEYDRTAHKLVQLFVDNFAQFEAHVDQGVRDAAPQAA
jgi:phosphoenolpyruvate carboxykinase (ATP)